VPSSRGASGSEHFSPLSSVFALNPHDYRFAKEVRRSSALLPIDVHYDLAVIRNPQRNGLSIYPLKFPREFVREAELHGSSELSGKLFRMAFVNDERQKQRKREDETTTTVHVVLRADQ
jgi:hypothetical protein